jgi:hypothetical protein
MMHQSTPQRISGALDHWAVNPKREETQGAAGKPAFLGQFLTADRAL